MPAMDLTRLTRSQLLQLVNGTPAGEVLTRWLFQRHVDAGGSQFRAPDGRVHFVRYVRWLAGRLDRQSAAADSADGSATSSAPGGQDYAASRDRQSQRNLARTRAAQDIAPIPEVADWERRFACEGCLRAFCEKYFPQAFVHPWAPDHLTAIATLQRVITGGGLFAFAMPRGSGKTTLARAAGLWAALYGHSNYVCLISGTHEKATKQLLEPIKMTILENHTLAADFPEALHALRRLENSSKRQLQQHCHGQLTHVRWEGDRVVFPTIRPEDLPPSFSQRGIAPLGGPRPAAQGAVLSIDSLEGEVRGQQHTRPDGTIARPSLVLLDDPQTRESAASSTQTRKRWDLIHADVLGMAGPDQTISAVAMVTVIFDNDLTSRLLDPNASPEWQGQKTRFFTSLPTDMALWDRYRAIRRDSVQRGHQGRESNSMYRRQRRAMDAGASVYWEHAYDHRLEISAIQHGMNLLLRNEQAFYAEYQNEPIAAQLDDERLTCQQVMDKSNGRPRGQVPPAAATLTAFVDVQDKVLFYAVCAWEADFTGYVIEYGTHPKQTRAWFTVRGAPLTLSHAHPGKSREAAIQAGLEELCGRLLKTDYQQAGGGVLRIGRLAIDVGYKGEIAAAVKHRLGGDTIQLQKGFGISARSRPLEEYRKKPGEVYGFHWYRPNVRGTREFPHAMADVNYWKTHVVGALAGPVGERGGLSIFGRPQDSRRHELFAEHIANSETWTDVTARGRTVREWTPRPSKPDNHWLDCLVGCAVGASVAGVRAAIQEAQADLYRTRKKYTQADLRRGSR